MKLWPPVTFPDVYCYLIVTPVDPAVDFTGEKLKAYNFVISGWVKSLQVLKRTNFMLIIPAMCSPSFVLKVRPTQRVNKKPHKVWVAVQTDGTILLSAGMTVQINEVRRRRPTTTVPGKIFIITNVNALIPAGNEPFTFSVSL